MNANIPATVLEATYPSLKLKLVLPLTTVFGFVWNGDGETITFGEKEWPDLSGGEGQTYTGIKSITGRGLNIVSNTLPGQTESFPSSQVN